MSCSCRTPIRENILLWKVPGFILFLCNIGILLHDNNKREINFRLKIYPLILSNAFLNVPIKIYPLLKINDGMIYSLEIIYFVHCNWRYDILSKNCYWQLYIWIYMSCTLWKCIANKITHLWLRSNSFFNKQTPFSHSVC